VSYFHHYHTKKYRMGIMTAAIILAAGMSLRSARAADPSDATYAWDTDQIFWIMHISDMHIGTEMFDEVPPFQWAMNEAIQVVNPVIVVNSGDLVDASPNGVVTSGQDDSEWQLYRSVVDESGVSADFYIDMPGNHDAYGDEGLTHYLQYSLNGSTYHKLARSVDLNLPFGEYFVYTTCTADETGSRFIEHPKISQDELDDMSAELTAHDSARLIFVFGHHPLQDPTNGDQAADMIKQHHGYYYHGHIHAYGSYLHDGIVTAQVNSMGKKTTQNLAVIAVDHDFVAYGSTDSEDPWPFILITAPARSKLDSDEANPYAYTVCNTATSVPVRALVFDLNTVSAVTVTAGNTNEASMTPDPHIHSLWTGTFDPSSLPEGEATLTVTAYGSKERSSQITFKVANVNCPTQENQDGGVTDGAGPDGQLGDSQQPESDAGADANTSNDGGQTDGSILPGGGNSGCGCHQSGGSTPLSPLGFILLAAVGLFLVRRRR